jgi:hypothetical protein
MNAPSSPFGNVSDAVAGRPARAGSVATDRTVIRQPVLGQRDPADQSKVDPRSVWRLLERAVECGELKREGTGLKNDPFRYWLPSLEALWRTDPMARLEQLMADNARDLLRTLPPTPFSERPDLE